MLAAHKTGSEIVSPRRHEHRFPNVAQCPGEANNAKGWMNDCYEYDII